MSLFKLKSPFAPAGSQVEAIKQLSKTRPGKSTLLGVTGSGKTYTIANVIAKQNKPVIVLSPNKTLAAQLYEEFSLFFPQNKVCYFVSYYDYYQPESYLPAQDIYIPKETKINSEVERLRIEAAASILNRRDTIIVTSVSCIYSLGNPVDYQNLALTLKKGQKIKRSDVLRELIFIQYVRNDIEKRHGTFQVLGDTVEVNLPYSKERLRIQLDEDVVESLEFVEKNNKVVEQLDKIIVFPAKHFVTTEQKKKTAIESIKTELEQWLPMLPNEVYKDRISKRVNHDLEMLEQMGICQGVENYSAHFDGRTTGQTPFCLFDFFEEFLLIVDESHIAIPQLKAMYAGDKARKNSLIEFGFRLPSAADNRPLKFSEFEKFLKDVIFVSATPGQYELENSDQIIQQVIRPTGLLDPVIEVKPRENQMQDLIEQIKQTSKKGFRSLVTVMTKKMAEELAYYLEQKQIKACYLHSSIKTPERTELLQKLRLGTFDCLVGVNLLREGLDLPEVAFVAVMDADVESFLRDQRSLIQIIGRAARNTESKVLFYADKITKSMQDTINETSRRRSLQQEYNKKHNIVPKTVKREVVKSIANIQLAIAQASQKTKKKNSNDPSAIMMQIISLEKKMAQAADELDFEKAIELRSKVNDLKEQHSKLISGAN